MPSLFKSGDSDPESFKAFGTGWLNLEDIVKSKIKNTNCDLY